VFRRLVGPRSPGASLRPLLGGWFLLVLFLHGACATAPSAPLERILLTPEPGLEGASVYAVDFVEPGAVSTRPVSIAKVEFQPAVQRLLVDVRLGHTRPKQAARELLRLLPPPPESEMVESTGHWRLETHHGRVRTLVPEKQDGPVRLKPEADEKLKAGYLQWCTGQGGGDCLCLLDDGPYLDAEDRRAFTLALAFGSVLDETREALTRELLDVRALISMVVWTVATSPQGPLAVVMLKKGPGSGAEMAPGGRSSETVVRHRGGNRQVQLDDGQRWHLPPGISVKDIPAEDTVGDLLQEAVTHAAKEWGPHRLSRQEETAIKEALKKGKYWLARLLEREARGRYVQTKVKQQFEHLYDFSLSKGVDVVDLATGTRYEILSGTDTNLARHGRRMAGEFFRMLTF